QAGAWTDAFGGAAGDLGVEVESHTLGDDFTEAYGVNSSGAVLVRPDGYVAWRSGDDAGAAPARAAELLGSLLCRSGRPAAATA
ncbi:MAG TPA: hypothetical protein VFL87_10835, partial [Thermoleophilaceae bacterium]|nr:hypothetical protein [Thermoleophilaceae bacterium]